MTLPSESLTLLSDCCLTVEGAALAEKHRRFYIRVLDYVYRVKGGDPCKPSLSQLFGVMANVQTDSQVRHQCSSQTFLDLIKFMQYFFLPSATGRHPLGRHPLAKQTPPPPPRWLLQQTVSILLECILVESIVLITDREGR